MFRWREIENTAVQADLLFFQDNLSDPVWWHSEDSPHFSGFEYSARTHLGSDDSTTEVAKVSGYRVIHDSQLSAEDVWEGADAVDTDCVSYVDALIREMACCRTVGLGDPDMLSARHITFLRHVALSDGQDAGRVWVGVTAGLLLQDAPTFLVVDPRAMPRSGTAGERFETRVRVAGLAELGLVRMVSAPLLWGWSVELKEGSMADYDYVALLEAKRRGELKGVVDEVIANRIYGPLSPEQLESFALPIPEEPVD